VIGLGTGLHQARILSSYNYSDLVTICDFEKNKLSEVQSEFVNVRKTEDDKDILLDKNIDLVCIASYDEFHHKQIISSLNNGKHVYVEKPICLYLKDLKNIYEELKKFPNLNISSNMVLRTCPLFKKVREAIMSKKLGDVYHIEADYLWGRKEKIISGWRSKTKYYSIIHGAAVHMIDLVLWLTGKKPVSVKALGSNIIVSGTNQKHNDFSILLLEFEDKMSIKISAHGGGVHPHFHSLKIFGSKKTFIHDYGKTIWINSNNQNQNFINEDAPYPAKENRNQALISFINHLINPTNKVLVPREDIFDSMCICFAAEESMKTGNSVPIKYF